MSSRRAGENEEEDAWADEPPAPGSPMPDSGPKNHEPPGKSVDNPTGFEEIKMQHTVDNQVREIKPLFAKTAARLKDVLAAKLSKLELSAFLAIANEAVNVPSIFTKWFLMMDGLLDELKYADKSSAEAARDLVNPDVMKVVDHVAESLKTCADRIDTELNVRRVLIDHEGVSSPAQKHALLAFVSEWQKERMDRITTIVDDYRTTVATFEAQLNDTIKTRDALDMPAILRDDVIWREKLAHAFLRRATYKATVKTTDAFIASRKHTVDPLSNEEVEEWKTRLEQSWLDYTETADQTLREVATVIGRQPQEDAPDTFFTSQITRAPNNIIDRLTVLELTDAIAIVNGPAFQAQLTAFGLDTMPDDELDQQILSDEIWANDTLKKMLSSTALEFSVERNYRKNETLLPLICAIRWLYMALDVDRRQQHSHYRRLEAALMILRLPIAPAAAIYDNVITPVTGMYLNPISEFLTAAYDALKNRHGNALADKTKELHRAVQEKFKSFILVQPVHKDAAKKKVAAVLTGIINAAKLDKSTMRWPEEVQKEFDDLQRQLVAVVFELNTKAIPFLTNSELAEAVARLAELSKSGGDENDDKATITKILLRIEELKNRSKYRAPSNQSPGGIPPPPPGSFAPPPPSPLPDAVDPTPPVPEATSNRRSAPSISPRPAAAKKTTVPSILPAPPSREVRPVPSPRRPATVPSILPPAPPAPSASPTREVRPPVVPSPRPPATADMAPTTSTVELLSPLVNAPASQPRLNKALDDVATICARYTGTTFTRHSLKRLITVAADFAYAYEAAFKAIHILEIESTPMALLHIEGVQKCVTDIGRHFIAFYKGEKEHGTLAGSTATMWQIWVDNIRPIVSHIIDVAPSRTFLWLEALVPLYLREVLGAAPSASFVQVELQHEKEQKAERLLVQLADFTQNSVFLRLIDAQTMLQHVMSLASLVASTLDRFPDNEKLRELQERCYGVIDANRLQIVPALVDNEESSDGSDEDDASSSRSDSDDNDSPFYSIEEASYSDDDDDNDDASDDDDNTSTPRPHTPLVENHGGGGGQNVTSPIDRDIDRQMARLREPVFTRDGQPLPSHHYYSSDAAFDV